jgi:hypothetical protein
VFPELLPPLEEYLGGLEELLERKNGLADDRRERRACFPLLRAVLRKLGEALKGLGDAVRLKREAL